MAPEQEEAQLELQEPTPTARARRTPPAEVVVEHRDDSDPEGAAEEAAVAEASRFTLEVDPSTGFPEGVDPDEALRAANVGVAADQTAKLEAQIEAAEQYDPDRPITEQPKIVAILNSDVKGE